MLPQANPAVFVDIKILIWSNVIRSCTLIGRLMMTESQQADWERQRGQEVLDRTRRNLKTYDFLEGRESAALVQTVYNLALPYLEQARHGNPIHHTAYVVEHIREIAFGDDVKDSLYPIRNELMVAAVLHDVGFANIPAGQKKIKLSDIEAVEDPQEKEELRSEAIRLRLQHMKEGKKIAQEILSKSIGEALDIGLILKIIAEHDSPTIAELVTEPRLKATWLFNLSTRESRALWAHREADRLWMLTIDGVIADLISDLKSGRTSITGLQKLAANIKRHEEEHDLYNGMSFAPKFSADHAFYIHHGSLFLYELYTKHTQSVFSSIHHYLSIAIEAVLK
jgi:hypothetical protein